MKLSFSEMITLLDRCADPESHPIALKIIQGTISDTPITAQDLVTVQLPSLGQSIRLPNIFVATKTVDNIDEQCLYSATRRFWKNPWRLRYDLQSYYLIDLLGCNGLFSNMKSDYKHPPRFIVTTDGTRVPLPRDMDYSSRVLNDEELAMDGMSVPFNDEQVEQCIEACLSITGGSCRCLRLLDFLGCHEYIGKLPRACLNVEDWKVVLQFKQCFELHLSRYQLQDQVISCGSDVRITRKRDGLHVSINKELPDTHMMIVAMSELGGIAYLKMHTLEPKFIPFCRSARGYVRPSSTFYKSLKKMMTRSLRFSTCGELEDLFQGYIVEDCNEFKWFFQRSRVENRLQIVLPHGTKVVAKCRSVCEDDDEFEIEYCS